MKITAVIMAGGRGERFWPKSRNNRPKQFLSLTSDGETMIQKTVKRLSPHVSAEDIFIVTNAAYAYLVNDQLPDVPRENILCEPCARNTAPCIAFAAAIIQKKYGDAMMLVLPSDHLIGYENIYIKTLQTAIRTAEEGNNLVTIGITPAYPETGYGYINFGKEAGDAYEVERFVEKPDLPTAKKYLASGGTDSYEEILIKEFTAFTSESVDFGIMEKASDIYTIPGSFGWDDVGSWLAVERINETDDKKNYFDGDVIAVDSERTTVCGGKRLVAAIGTRDIVIVDTDDVLLVCSKNNTQDVKKVIAQLKEHGRNDLV